MWALILTKKMLRPLHFLLLNEDQEGKWLSWEPGLDFTSDASLAAVKDKASLEKQSCWEVTPHHSAPFPHRQAGKGHSWQLLSQGEWGQADSSCYKDVEQRFQEEGWVQECFYKNMCWSPGVSTIDCKQWDILNSCTCGCFTPHWVML